MQEKIYIQTLRSRIFNFTESHFDSVLCSAYSCPMINPEAVYGARAIIKLYFNKIFKDLELCNQAGMSFKTTDTLLQKNEVEMKVKIYPNPAKDRVQISLSLISKGETMLQVTDLLGKMVFQKKENLKSKEYSINTEQWPAGTYLISIFNEGIVSENAKIIIYK